MDLRIEKTYKNLFNALQELMCEKNFDEITVIELCSKAQTRKATFYKHFSDKSDLFIFMIQTLQEKYDELHKRSYKDDNSFSFYSGIISYSLDFIEEHEKMAVKILNSKSKWQLLDLLSSQIETDLKYHLYKDSKNNLIKYSIDYLSSIFAGALVEAISYWILNKEKLSKEEAIEQFYQLVESIYH